MNHFKYTSLAVAALMGLQACSAETPAGDDATYSDAQDTAISQPLMDMKILAADDMGGREAGTEANAMARAYIIKRLKQIGVGPETESYEQTFVFTPRSREGQPKKADITGTNVIGKIKGKSSDYTMVVSAHFDHVGTKGDDIYNGADDNASGVAGVLAVAEHFMAEQPEYDVVIALWDAEEKGLQGARAYVAADENIADNVDFNLNLDMISRDINNELYATGTYHYTGLLPMIEEVAKTAPLKLIAGKDIPGTGSADWTFSSDHGAFHQKEIPFIYLGVDFHPDYHKPTDTYENATLDYFVRAVETTVQAAEYFDANLASVK